MKATCMPSRGRWVCVLYLGLACIALGCGPRRVQVTGTVRFKGKPLPSARVSFFSPDNQVESAFVETDGTYTMARALVGPTNVTVQTPGRPPGPPFDMPQSKMGPPGHAERIPAGQYVPIPHRYADPKTSGLTCQVEKHGQVYEINLEP
jgi:hypothetical protein